jgi:hypothetical protein
MNPTVTIDLTPVTLAERLEDAGIVFTDTPDGYHVNAGPEVTILVRPSPNEDGHVWVTVTRPDASERDTGGVAEDDYETTTHEAAVRLVCSFIDCF